MGNEQVLEQRIDRVEDDVDVLKEEVKELNRRVNSHDTAIAKIELIVEGMKSDWVMIRNDIQRMMTNQPSSQNQDQDQHNNTKTFVVALKDITIELVKTIGLIVAAFLAAKTFFH